MSIVPGNNIRVKDLEVANEELYASVAAKHNISPSLVEEMILHVGKFVEKTIARGAYESVMIPNFGKFRAKPHTVTKVENFRHFKRRLDEATNNGE